MLNRLPFTRLDRYEKVQLRLCRERCDSQLYRLAPIALPWSECIEGSIGYPIDSEEILNRDHEGLESGKRAYFGIFGCPSNDELITRANPLPCMDHQESENSLARSIAESLS